MTAVLGPRKPAADTSVTRAAAVLQRSVRRYKILAWVVVGLLIGMATGSGLLWRSLEAQREADYRNCLAGNSFRADQTRIWAEFSTLATAGNHDPRARQFVRVFMAYVNKVDTPRTCHEPRLLP